MGTQVHIKVSNYSKLLTKQSLLSGLKYFKLSMGHTVCCKQVGRSLAHRWRSLRGWRLTPQNCQTVLHLHCRRHWPTGSFQSSKARLNLFLRGDGLCRRRKQFTMVFGKRKILPSYSSDWSKTVAAENLMSLLGAVSSFSFWSLSAMAWSSLLRPLVGRWPALLFLLPPCARGCADGPCCLASSAATRLWMKYEL